MSKRGGHHGGAWKVAYADFVTAMMALFLVLWLTAQDEKIKEAVERAFRHPFSSMTKESVGIIPSDNAHAVENRSGNFDAAAVVELNLLRRLSEDLMKYIDEDSPDDPNRSLDLELSNDSLRISVFDRSRRPVFKGNTPEFTEYGDWVFTTLAWTIARYDTFSIELEGHTEAGHEQPRENYGNWELSTDRANSARRKLLQHGVTPAQVRKVAGYADTLPIEGHEPDDEKNRRVTVMLKIRSETT